MSLLKIISFGVAIRLIYLVAAYCSLLALTNNGFIQVLTAVLPAVLSYIFARINRPEDVSQALEYGVIWTITGLFFDWALTNRLISSSASIWAYWVGYILLLFTPVLACLIKNQAKKYFEV